ncbi:MAG: glycosyltransferase [Pseudobutyrivibrio ruminis]|uniref:Glycosyltransferase n=1 Tax=Pseudobutyrivibrio ruminis TaxID=46206 RepID=A0A927YM31_9FIRM|nr:glycosyltransferase [Pseudobutyrivibrio ruminis]
MNKFSVLMSVYNKEKKENIIECFESIMAQTKRPNEWVVVEDGPLTDELYAVLDNYEKKTKGIMKRVRLEKNSGLGVALGIGVEACANELIARMDTDDIAINDRFEKQLEAFDNDDMLDICGTYIDEFENEKDNVVASRIVPLTDLEIKKYQRRRDAFNHMTVMFKKSAVLKAGNYKACPLMEDTYLWVRMMQNGAKCKNIPESLVLARVGEGMYERRGGIMYFDKYRKARRIILKTGYITSWDYIYTVFIQFIVAIIPNRIRGGVYKRILHKKNKVNGQH